jgi:hypothetical protein
VCRGGIRGGNLEVCYVNTYYIAIVGRQDQERGGGKIGGTLPRAVSDAILQPLGKGVLLVTGATESRKFHPDLNSRGKDRADRLSCTGLKLAAHVSMGLREKRRNILLSSARETRSQLHLSSTLDFSRSLTENVCPGSPGEGDPEPIQASKELIRVPARGTGELQ